MEATCNQEMILKFGRIVNLEEIEQVTVNRQVEELKEKLRATEVECSDDLKSWEVGTNYILPHTVTRLQSSKRRRLRNSCKHDLQ